MKSSSINNLLSLRTYLGATLFVILSVNIIGEAFAIDAQAHAEQPTTESAKKTPDQLAKINIVSSLPKDMVVHINATAVKGIYQVELITGELTHMTEDGQYMINGDLLKVHKNTGQEQFKVTNFTEEHRKTKRAQLIAEMDRSTLITYPAEGEKKVQIFVFTDTDCGYCRKMHEEVPQMQSMGVEVNYLAWPRAGTNSKTGKNMTNIWCSKDKLSNMDKGKRGGQVKASAENFEQCAETVESHRQLGVQLNVRGTPAVYLKDGRKLGGYITADQLYEQIDL